MRPRVTLPPAEAWCVTCRGMQPFRLPTVLTLHEGVTMREGPCATCGGPLWRVGGARNAEGERKRKKPYDPPEDLLFLDESLST